MTMQRMVDILENRGFKTTKTYNSELRGYEFTIERSGIKFSDFFKYPTYSDKPYLAQSEFLDRIIFNFEKIEQEKKNMKNIAFDISRDGPVGKLVIKDNVYDVCVKEVDSYSSPYDTNTVLKVEVSGKNLFEPKCVTRTDSISAQFEAYKRLCIDPFTTYRKDSINDGKLQIKNVIFNPPATIVFWSDGSKTVVKAENEIYDPEKGLAMAIAKRAMGNQGNYFETFKKYVGSYKKKVMDEEFARFAEEYADKFDRVNVMSAEQIKEVLKNSLYRIWYKSEDGTETVYAKEYVKEGNAVRVARKIFAGTNTKWVVAREDPFKNGVWEKAFGSGDK